MIFKKDPVMKKTNNRILLLCGLFPVLVLSACQGNTGGDLKLHDGYFTAEAASFDNYGWKEFVSIYVNSNKIITVEYNAKNESGFIKSWDMEYMRRMNAADGIYPNKYTRLYAVALLNRQDPSRLDAITGATDSYHSFRLLSRAAIEQAKTGDKKVAFVDIPAGGSR
jgi:major membrane immunogen (membrane-anchored lipoprotein)